MGQHKINIYLKQDDIQVSEHLHHSEVRCKCEFEDCSRTMMSEWLLTAFENMRAEIGIPLAINSGFRCQRHNSVVGGADNSNHKFGMALDIAYPKGAKNSLKALAVKYFEEVRIYDTFIHCGVRR